jgi:hypothetical protein
MYLRLPEHEQGDSSSPPGSLLSAVSQQSLQVGCSCSTRSTSCWGANNDESSICLLTIGAGETRVQALCLCSTGILERKYQRGCMHILTHKIWTLIYEQCIIYARRNCSLPLPRASYSCCLEPVPC